MNRLLRYLVYFLIIAVGVAAGAFLMPPEVNAEEIPTYTVGIKEARPFSYQQNGEWTGASVDLLHQISKDLKFNIKFVEVVTVPALLNLVEFNSTDIAIGAISMTEEREKNFDFSHPYFQTTQGILIKENGNIVWFVAQRVGVGFLVFVLALYVIGFIISKSDPDDEINNIHKGAWFVLTTFTTTGYGDYVPRNARAKLLAAGLMIVSMFTLSAFTGYISSALTVEKLTSDPTTIQSLYNSNVVTIGGTTSSKLLDLLGIKYKRVTSIGDAVKLVQSGKAKAFIYDKAMLDYVVKEKDNTLNSWPIPQGQERYAIAFPTGSELREPFNIAILNTINSSEWKNITSKYFGD